jgi:UDP-glucuronate 4-epimerase
MAYYSFTKTILAGEPITIFNQGNMRRDFTYIDDIVQGVLAALDRPPVAKDGEPAARLYNLGNSKAEKLMDFVATIESVLGKKARYDFQPMQPGDVPETFADITDSIRDLGFRPRTGLQEGIARFAAWYKSFHTKT